MHWRTRRWVEVTKPIPQVKGETLADELVDDGGDGTLRMHKGTETEDGSLPERVPGADQGEHKVGGAPSRRSGWYREGWQCDGLRGEKPHLQKTHLNGQLGTVLPISDKSRQVLEYQWYS